MQRRLSPGPQRETIVVKKYKAILFDFFETVVSFNLGELATKEGGLDIKKLIERSYLVFHQYYAKIDFEEFHAALRSIYQESMIERERHLREIPAEDRFKRLFTRLNIPLSSDSKAPLEEILKDHMETIKQVSFFPQEHYRVLETLSKNYKLGLVSNFDHSATLFDLLEKFGIRHLFQQVIVSVDIGIRKPHPDIFLKALEGLGVKAEEAIFVGDDQKADLLGPKELGMAVAWLKRKGKTLQEGIPRPDYEIGSLKDLLDFLCLDGHLKTGQ